MESFKAEADLYQDQVILVMTETGKMISPTVKEFRDILMDHNMREISLMGKSMMIMQFIDGLTEKYIKGHSEMVTWKAKAD